MGSHPINLGIRFLLELAALYSMGLWGWKQSEGPLRYLLALGIPVLFAIAWGTFAVPDDPSRSGAAPIPVPGFLRLLLELAFFFVAAWMLHNVGLTTQACVFGVIVLVHYVVSYDRILWLLKQ